MAPEATQQRHMVGLPLIVVGPVDLGRLVRELEAIENALQSVRLRSPTEELKLPKTSRMMDEVASLNKLNLLRDRDRKDLKQFLVTVRENAPSLHMSFSADPSPLFTSKIMAWLRDQIHPVVLLTIGLQPGIGAGCVVRTPNKYFDLSLGKDFTKHRDLLMTKLREAPEPKAPPAPASPKPAAVAPAAQAAVQAAAPQTTASTPRAAAPHAKEVHA